MKLASAFLGGIMASSTDGCSLRFFELVVCLSLLFGGWFGRGVSSQEMKLSRSISS